MRYLEVTIEDVFEAGAGTGGIPSPVQPRLGGGTQSLRQAMRPEEIDAKGRLLGTIGNQNQSRQSLASRAKLIDGQSYLANGRPAYGSGGGMRLGDEVVGVGLQLGGCGRDAGGHVAQRLEALQFDGGQARLAQLQLGPRAGLADGVLDGRQALVTAGYVQQLRT